MELDIYINAGWLVDVGLSKEEWDELDEKERKEVIWECVCECLDPDEDIYVEVKE